MNRLFVYAWLAVLLFVIVGCESSSDSSSAKLGAGPTPVRINPKTIAPGLNGQALRTINDASAWGEGGGAQYYGGTGILVDGSTIAVGPGIPTSDLSGTIPIDAGTAGGLPTSRLVGTIPIDAGTSGQLPASRIAGSVTPSLYGARGICIDGGAVGLPAESAGSLFEYYADGGIWSNAPMSVQPGTSGTLIWPSTSTAPGMSQLTAASGYVPNSMVFVTEGPNAGSSTVATETPGNFDINFPAPGASGNYPVFEINSGGTFMAAIGQYNPSYAGLFFGVGVGVSLSTAVLLGSSSTTFLSAPETVGTIEIGYGDQDVNLIGTYQGWQFGYEIGAQDFGGGNGVLGIGKAQANPSASSTGSVIYADSSSGDFAIKPPSATSTTYDFGTSTFTVNAATVVNTPSAGNGTTTSEQAVYTTNATPNTSMSLVIPSNTSGTVSAIISARRAGDAGVSGGSATWSCGVLNNHGTCITYTACAASTTWGSTDAGTAWSASLAMSSCNAVVTVTGVASTNIDWSAVFQYASAR
jgi:hypothetical protein